MKIIPTTIHGLLDYIVGLMLILSPLFLADSDNSSSNAVLIFSGVLTIIYSSLTDYEYGIVPMIPMKIHLALDITAAVFLLTSPWICGFYYQVYLPHVLFATMELAVISMSQIIPKSKKSTLNQSYANRKSTH